MNQLTRYIRIMIVIMIALNLVACTTNNKPNTRTNDNSLQTSADSSGKDIIEIPEKKLIELPQQNENDIQVNNQANIVDNSQQQKHIIKDNIRINTYYKANKHVDKIYFGKEAQLIQSYSIKAKEIEFISEYYGGEEKTIHTQPLDDNDEVFCINDKIIGINSNKGVRFIYCSTSTNYYDSFPLRLNDDFTKAIGKKVISFENNFYKEAKEFLQMNFVEYTEGNLRYLASFDNHSPQTYKISLEGNLLDVKKLATDDFVTVIKLNDHTVRITVINYKCEIQWTSDYILEEGMEYKGVTVSAYNTFNVFFNDSKLVESRMIQYNINNKQIQSTYQIPLSFEYISDQYNMYLIIGVDKENTKRLYVCDRNYVILDQIDFGTNTMSKINHLLFNRTYTQEKIPNISGIIDYNNESYIFNIELLINQSKDNLFPINEEDRVNIDSTNQINYVFNYHYVYSNFNNILGISTIKNSPYFIVNNALYHYDNDLITKVREWNMNLDNIHVFELLNKCYAFYKDDQYLFSHSLFNNHQEEGYYNQMLAGTSKPLIVYPDIKNNDVLIKDSKSIYTLSYGKDKKLIGSNCNEMDLVENIRQYKNGSTIFIYDNYSFYSYDEFTDQWIYSKFDTTDTMDVFQNDNGIVLHSFHHAYHYNKDTHKLIKISLPEDGSRYWYYKVQNGKLMMNDYYYDLTSRSFIPSALIEPQMFEGVINDKYYYHVLNREMGNTSPEIVLYTTPYIPYYFNDQEIKLIDYRLKDSIPYIIEYETNHLYKIEEGNMVKAFENSIRTYDISTKYIAYTSYIPNEQLYLHHINDNYEELIFDGSVDNIYIDEINIYYRNLNDHNLYRYNIETKDCIRLTDSGGIYNMYYVEDNIIYQDNTKIYLMDNVDLKINDTLEGSIKVVNDKDNELIYNCSDLTLIYNIATMKNKVISYNNMYYSINSLLGDKAVVFYYDGPVEIFVKDYKETSDFESAFDVNKFQMNEQYTIADVGCMYGMDFYVYENNTLKHHKVVDSLEDYNEEKEWDGDDPVILYYDTNSIYFQKLDETTNQGYVWIKYTPSVDTEEIVDDVDTKGLNRIVGMPRGA